MLFYNNLTFYSTGAALTAVTDLTAAPIGTEFRKTSGEVWIKTANGVYDKSVRQTLSRVEGDARYARLGVDNSFASNQLPETNITYDVGSVTHMWANMYATTFHGNAITANYADIAEKYIADADYPIGTVVEIGGTNEITRYSGGALAGVISELPGVKLNEGSEGQYVALKGKIPALCTTPIFKGQYCVAVLGGIVVGINKQLITPEDHLNIVGVALEDYNPETMTVMTKV